MSGLFNFANMSDGIKIIEKLNKRKKIFYRKKMNSICLPIQTRVRVEKIILT